MQLTSTSCCSTSAFPLRAKHFPYFLFNLKSAVFPFPSWSLWNTLTCLQHPYPPIFLPQLLAPSITTSLLPSVQWAVKGFTAYTHECGLQHIHINARPCQLLQGQIVVVFFSKISSIKMVKPTLRSEIPLKCCFMKIKKQTTKLWWIKHILITNQSLLFDLLDSINTNRKVQNARKPKE